MARPEPAYVDAVRSGVVAERLKQAEVHLRSCRLCPRCCEVDRQHGEIGVCGAGEGAEVATVFPSFSEAEPLRGTNGSGALVFTGCSLRCVFCKDEQIASGAEGRPVDADELADMMLDVQERWCHNLNLVTPHHVVPTLLEALPMAVERGFRLPIVYNSSGYDSVSTLRLLDGIVDLYLVDFKFWDADEAARLVGSRDYPDVARRAIAEMHRQVGDLDRGDDGVARRGLIVRHLVMPGKVGDAGHIFRFLAEEISPDTYLQIMGQYVPAALVQRNPRYADVDRRTSWDEVSEAYRLAEEAGLRNLGTMVRHDSDASRAS